MGIVTKAFLVHIDFAHSNVLARHEENLQELYLLTKSAEAEPVAVVLAKRDRPDSKYFMGSGKVEELKEVVNLHQPQLVIVNHDLSPSQQRNIETHINCRVIDRTELILDIFAKRARSFEG